MRALLNQAVQPELLEAPGAQAARFHSGLADYQPTPIRRLDALAAELGIGEVLLKDESHRLGLPAFKILGASWAIERALREQPDTRTLVAGSAGNHGRAVARVARLRGLRSCIFLPARATPARVQAIEAEGAQAVVVGGSYDDALACAERAGAEPGTVEIADAGASFSARWVIDGYATLFAEAAAQCRFDLLVVPAGVGSLAAAAARFAAQAGVQAIAVEPVNAACLTAALRAGAPVSVPTPGTVMAGLDCAEVSAAAWSSLRHGVHGTVTVTDAETQSAVRELAAAGLVIGASGAAPLAALRALSGEPGCSRLSRAVGLGPSTRALLIATEGATDPVTYQAAVA